MNPVTQNDLTSLYIPSPDSHKGQNGKLMIIGGSHLFHAASLWALEVASRIVDLVHYSSVPENNTLVSKLKQEFRDGIVVRREDVESYIVEDDAVLIGPGMTRDSETEELTNRLLSKHPHKQWIIDAGALQMLDLAVIPRNAILTPHKVEFERLWEKYQGRGIKDQGKEQVSMEDKVKHFTKEYRCVVLLKEPVDIACPPAGGCRVIEGGNPGMTKGGTGDVLAGLIAALACKNDPFLATIAGSFINKKAGDQLYQRVGPYFNASDLADEIPSVMHTITEYALLGRTRVRKIR